MRLFFSKIFSYLSLLFLKLSKKTLQEKSKLIITGNPRSQYKLPSGALMLLNQDGYIDNQLINHGIFESNSTNLVLKLVKPGDIVFDVGANIGYYSIIFSKLVGSKGKVYAFEPTLHFRRVLEENIILNKINNIEIIDEGLSNANSSLEIEIGPSSATLHPPEGYDKTIGHESIKLTTLDAFVSKFNIDHIDFIKVDIDGHEPHFFDGAWDVLDKFNVVILFEISHLHYLEGGVTAWDFYKKLIDKKYNIYHENGLKKILSINEFLVSCADFSSSCNVIATKQEISI